MPEEFASDPKSRRSVERVTLNGEDVTSRCYMIDEDAQLVGLFVRDEQGRLILREDRRPKTAMVYGVVEVTRKTTAHLPKCSEDAPADRG